MVVKRKIPYGVINWAELVRDCFFVDSTAHIRALETCKTPVFLVLGAVGVFAVRYSSLADWTAATRMENAAGMIDRLRDVVKAEHLPPLCVVIDEYDNFTNELVVSGRDLEYDDQEHVRRLLRRAVRLRQCQRGAQRRSRRPSSRSAVTAATIGSTCVT